MKLVKIWLLIVSLSFLGGLFYFTESFSSSTAANGAEPESPIGGPFHLIDQNGKKVSDKDFKGRLMLVYFGFTNCPGVCPVDMAMITDSLKKLGKAADKVAPIFITVDPVHDNPAALKKYLKNYYPTFTGLTGSEKQIKEVEKEYKVYAEESATPGIFNHSSNIYLMDAEGKYLTHFAPGVDAEQVAAGIKKYL